MTMVLRWLLEHACAAIWNRCDGETRLKLLAAAVVVFIGGAAIAYAQGKLDPDDMRRKLASELS